LCHLTSLQRVNNNVTVRIIPDMDQLLCAIPAPWPGCRDAFNPYRRWLEKIGAAEFVIPSAACHDRYFSIIVPDYFIW
jgi:hypothetical protein